MQKTKVLRSLVVAVVGKVTVTVETDVLVNPSDDVVEVVSRLIRFDTTNTGDPETTRGEAECAQWVASQLEIGRAHV